MARPRPMTLVEDVPQAEKDDGNGRELAAAVQLAVEDLRDDHRAVFVLYHERGQNYDEIAHAIGHPVGTVKTWLHRARAAVLEHLKRAGLVNDSKQEI